MPPTHEASFLAAVAADQDTPLAILRRLDAAQTRAKHGSGDCIDAASGVCSDVSEGRAHVCPNHQPVVRRAIEAALGFTLANRLVRSAVRGCMAGVLRRALTGSRGDALRLSSTHAHGVALIGLLRAAADAEGECIGEADLLEAILDTANGSAPVVDAPCKCTLMEASGSGVCAASYLTSALSQAEWHVLRAKQAVSWAGKILQRVTLDPSEEAMFDRHRFALCVQLGVVTG